MDILEPNFFTHSEPYLSPADREEWQSNRIRISLADYDSLPAFVTSLRDILEPYSPPPPSEPGFFSWASSSSEMEAPSMGVVVELTDWDATLNWKLDDLSASERAPDVKFKEWEDLKQTRHCQKWWEPLIVRLLLSAPPPLSMTHRLVVAARWMVYTAGVNPERRQTDTFPFLSLYIYRIPSHHRFSPSQSRLSFPVLCTVMALP